jgi:hypothetical protein
MPRTRLLDRPDAEPWGDKAISGITAAAVRAAGLPLAR